MGSVHFSSKTCEWSTPQELFDKLDAEFHFTLDVCATKQNAKCKKYFTEKDDGLGMAWPGIVWMNPPYGRQIQQWVKKAYESSLEGATVVCLLPARTCTRWFHDYCLKGEVQFIKGRLKFGGVKDNAPFPNMLVIFRPQAALQSPPQPVDSSDVVEKLWNGAYQAALFINSLSDNTECSPRIRKLAGKAADDLLIALPPLAAMQPCAGMGEGNKVANYVRDNVYHEAQDSEWDIGFNKAKSMCISAILTATKG